MIEMGQIQAQTVTGEIETINDRAEVGKDSSDEIMIKAATVNITSRVDDIGQEANANLDIANGLDSEVNRFKLD